MNLRYQETFCIIFLLCTSITLGEDFDFVPETNDDVEPISAEPLKVDSQTKPILLKAGVRCLPTESTIQLSLILRSKSWKHVQASLKQRTITKLAEYFLVPEESFIVQDAKSNELHKMVEKSLQHGKKPPRTGKSLGWIGFPVGCGEKMSAGAKETVRNLNAQMADIRDITGMDFGWWIIWKDQATVVSQGIARRVKREVDEDDYAYDYDDDEASDDDEGETTEVPHAHRHHHGSSEQYSTKSVQSSPTHTTNKHTNNGGHSEKRNQTPDGGQVSEHGRGGVPAHRKPPPLVTSTIPTLVPPKRKHNHGLYDQVKERSAKKLAAALNHNHQSDRTLTSGTEKPDTGRHLTPPDLRESVSQLESTISKTIANNEQLKKDEETLLARKAKHKRIDIERIVETELLLPEIERLQDEVFRDDYVIEDVVRGPKFYDFTTQPQPDGAVEKFIPLDPAVTEKQHRPVQVTTLDTPKDVKGSSPKPTTVKPLPVTVGKTTTQGPITTTKGMPLTSSKTNVATSERTVPSVSLTSVTSMDQIESMNGDLKFTTSTTTTTKDPRADVTPLVSSIDADEDAPFRSDVTTTVSTTSTTSSSTNARLKVVTNPTTTAIATRIEDSKLTTSMRAAVSSRPKAGSSNQVDFSTTTTPAAQRPPSLGGTSIPTTTTASITTATVDSTIPTSSVPIPPSAFATNTRSANIVASVPLVKGDDEGTSTTNHMFDTPEKAPTSTVVSPPFIGYTHAASVTPSSTPTTPNDPWSSGQDNYEHSMEMDPFEDEVERKSSPSAITEVLTSTTSSSVDDVAPNGLETELNVEHMITTISTIPLTTIMQDELRRQTTHDRHPLARGTQDEEDASEDDEDQEEEDIDEEEEDYFSQGVRITVLPPNLPPILARADDPEPVTSTLTSEPVDSINPTEESRSYQYSSRNGANDPSGMASPATTNETAAITSADSSATMTTASNNPNTFTTTTPPTGVYIPTTVTASTTTTTTTTPTITTTTTTTTTTSTTSTTSFASTTTAATTVPASNPSTTLAPEPDTVATSTTLELQPTSTQRSAMSFTTPKRANVVTEKDVEYENYDDEYDDEEEEGAAHEMTTVSTLVDPRLLPSSTEKALPTTTEVSTVPSTTTTEAATSSMTSTTTTTSSSSSTSTTSTTEAPTTTTLPSTTTTTTPTPTTTSTMPTTELDEPTNLSPTIRNRIPKQAITAGKVYRYQISLDTFYDIEDGNNLRLELLDAREQPLKPTSWVRFNEDTKEIYGLPLEKDVSRWQYKLRATDSGNLSVTENFDVQVQQHKSHRSLNHEISLALRLNRKFTSSVDWHIETARGISNVLGDVTLANIIVRDIRSSIQDPNLATFVYTNETLPKDRCPEEKLDELMTLLTEQALNDALNPDITVKSVQGQQIAQCTKPTLPKVKPTQSISRNYAPQTRNQVDQVNATVGHLLVLKVPVDTFYDPEDGNELKLKLLTTERQTLDPYHWLQFDSKNQEFYGVPRTNDIGRKEYLLMAEDREGLTATDALVVVVNAHHKRDYSVLFELTLDITHEQFSTAQVQRRFIERLAQVFGDASTHYIKIHHIRPIHHTGQVQVSFFNTTLNRQHQRCPQEEIETLRNILLHQDSTIRAKVRETLGQEFSLQNVSLVPLDNCHGFDTPHHATSEPEKAAPKPISKDDYLLTFVLPTVIILIMLFFASIIACVLYKRRLTGKMELGTDEERKSFRSKGIPVIFQDELDEKPEIGNKSPVILKDEKPPLLPPSYSSTNNEGENEDVDEYVPPQPMIVGGRESRGKSPVTPSYRRPPPYVSP